MAKTIHPDLGGDEEDFKQAVNALNENIFDKLEDYFPRTLKDYDGLMKDISGGRKSELQKMQEE